MPKPPKAKLTTATIRIDALGRRGDGIGTHDGRPAFIPRALPGELVRARLAPDRGQGHAGQLETVLEPSPQRVPPPCPHYDQCGGCALQHWDGAAYADWAITHIHELMERNGLTVGHWPAPVFVAERTRRRATWAALNRGGKIFFGYHAARSHMVADIPACLLLAPRLQAAMDKIRAILPALLADGQDATIFAQDTGTAIDVLITGQIGPRRAPQLRQHEAFAALVQDGSIARISWRLRERDTPEIMLQPAPVTKQAGPLAVPLPPGAFMQPSREGEDALIAAACAPLSNQTDLNIADLFAGSGTFTGPLLAHGRVTAVESDRAAIAALSTAARTRTDVTTVERNLFTDPLSATELAHFDAVLFDPPRAGAKEQAAQIAQSTVPLVIGISCNPATFARDAKMLCDGGYKLDSLQIVDQFTWSAHTELVGIFRR